MIDKELYQELKDYCSSKGIKISFTLNQIIKNFLNQNK